MTLLILATSLWLQLAVGGVLEDCESSTIMLTHQGNVTHALVAGEPTCVIEAADTAAGNRVQNCEGRLVCSTSF